MSVAGICGFIILYIAFRRFSRRGGTLGRPPSQVFPLGRIRGAPQKSLPPGGKVAPKGPDEGALPPKSLPPRGPTPLIKGRWPKARGDRERWLAEGQTDEGATIERFRLSQGDSAVCGRRVSFWMPRKKPKRHQGAAQDEFWMPRKKPKRHQGAAQDERFALIFAAPGPHFTGAQLGSLAVNAKARAAQLTGSRSMTAAAEWSVTFGGCFDRWKARLLCGWGSSAAQGTGGRVRTPAPTEYPETRLSLRRGRSQTGPGVPAGGPVCRPYDEKRTGSVGSVNSGAETRPRQKQILPTQGPGGPGKNRAQALQILRAGNPMPSPRGNPRNGGPGVRRI